MMLRLLAIGLVCVPLHNVLPAVLGHEGGRVGAELDNLPDVLFPKSHAIVDVTMAPYLAKGDGNTDDTDAIQRALDDTMGLHKVLYFPTGTYLVSKTLMWSKKNSAGNDAWGKNYLQGQNVAKTIIRLKDATFTNSNAPQSIMWCGGFGSADWFHNYVQDLTFDIGRGNPGAIGLQFYTNNSGAVRNCRFVDADRIGMIGLDLGHRDMNGPLLVKNCEVSGFQRGITTANAVNGQTFENTSLQCQSEVGFDNAGQAISICGLASDNSVPALRVYGAVCLVNAILIGRNAAATMPAIINFNGGRIFLRDVQTSGYKRALADVETPDSSAAYHIEGPDKLGSEGPLIAEYFSHAATSPFASPTQSLRLPVKDPPSAPQDAPEMWANVDEFGADPTGQSDSSAAIQKAMDSGAKTIFMPGHYALRQTIVIGGKVQRIVGVGGMIDYTSQVKPDFRIIDGDAPAVHIEHFSHIHGGIEIDTQRTLVMRSVQDADLHFTANATGGEIFLEDVVTHHLKLRNQRLWARQLNVENEGTHIENNGSDLWILGYKTERGGTLLKTSSGGRSEVLGGFSYTTTAGKLAPMFVNSNSSVFAFFAEVCFNGEPFETIVTELRGQDTRSIQRLDGNALPYIGVTHYSRIPK